MIYKTIIRPIFALVAALVLGACTQEFDPNVDVTPVPVLNIIAQSDSTLAVSVTRSWKFGGSKPKDIVQQDANVTFAVNGGEQQAMSFDDVAGKYTCDYLVRQGDRIAVYAQTKNYGAASAAATVPVVVKIDSLSCTAIRTFDPDGMMIKPDGSLGHMEMLEFHYRITFTDPAGEENYYMLSRNFRDDSEPIFNENNSPLDEVFLEEEDFYVFSDRRINGTTYTLNFKTVNYLRALRYENMVDEIKLYSISRDYYKYMLSIYKKYCGLSGMLEEYGLAEPKDIYTNVQGGTGIFATTSCDVRLYDRTEDVKRLVPELTLP